MKGYWNQPEATAETLRDGWLHTGDLATMDDDGYFTIVDRIKDMIIVSGFNVYPREVEETLFKHPAVADAAVVEYPDPYQGESVMAFVVLKPGRVRDRAGYHRLLPQPDRASSSVRTRSSSARRCRRITRQGAAA